MASTSAIVAEDAAMSILDNEAGRNQNHKYGEGPKLMLLRAILTNDSATFTGLVQENQDILDQYSVPSSTVLHITTRLGRTQMVREITKRRPDMAGLQNVKFETPFHEACRQGNLEVLKMLLEAYPPGAGELNFEKRSPLFLACRYGHVDVVDLLLNQTWLLELELEAPNDITCLHVAASGGHTGIVRRLVHKSRKLAQVVDKNGYSPLHNACGIGHSKIVHLLLYQNPDLARQYNNHGYTPLHLAAINGSVAVLEEFISLAPISFHFHTAQDETVFHLCARFMNYDAFVCLDRVFRDTHILHQPDQYGNTILHLALAQPNFQMAEYIIQNTRPNVNHKNQRGNTALDLMDQAAPTILSERLLKMLEEVGAKKGHNLPSRSDLQIPPEADPTESEEDKVEVKEKTPSTDDNPFFSELRFSVKSSERGGTRHKRRSYKHKQSNQNKQLQKTSSKLHEIRSGSRKMYREGLQNVRNTITVVAILIASLTFTSAINPPGGVYQDGPLKGKSIMARTRPFRVFVICNVLALFTSLCIVIVLVSIVPFRKKPLKKLLFYAHRAMWVAVSFTAASYVAATWVITPEHGPRGRGTDWTLAAIISICSGSLGMVFFCLTVMLTRQRLTKLKRKKNKIFDTTIADKEDIHAMTDSDLSTDQNLSGYFTH